MLVIVSQTGIVNNSKLTTCIEYKACVGNFFYEQEQLLTTKSMQNLLTFLKLRPNALCKIFESSIMETLNECSPGDWSPTFSSQPHHHCLHAAHVHPIAPVISLDCLDAVSIIVNGKSNGKAFPRCCNSLDNVLV